MQTSPATRRPARLRARTRQPDARSRVAAALFETVAGAIRGKDDAVRLALVALLSGSHLLVEDVPGTGKTLLGKSLAAAIGGRFGRIQCTPDLLPSDLTGTVGLLARDRQLGLPSRAGVRERRARRRGEPRVAAHPGRVARADGRAPGDRRRRHPRASRPVLHDRDAEPARYHGHVPAARESARPLRARAHDGPARARRRTRDPHRRRRRGGAAVARAGDDARSSCAT